MTEDTQKKIKKGYMEEEIWKRVRHSLASDHPNQGLPNGTGFVELDGLLYYEQGTKHRLCIPRALESEIFAEAHDRRAHAGFHRTFT